MNRKRKDILRFLMTIAAAVVVMVVSQHLFFRLDFTEDNRYSVSDVTLDVFGESPSTVYVDVYFEGFPKR